MCLVVVTSCANGNNLSAKCDPAVSARDNFSAEVNALWAIRSAEIDATDKVLDKEYQDCLSAPQKFLRIHKNYFGVKYLKCEEYVSDNKVPRVGTIEMTHIATKMYMVVTNNPECFKPEEVVEAQIQLGN